MPRHRSRDGRIVPNTSFGTIRRFAEDGSPIDTPPGAVALDTPTHPIQTQEEIAMPPTTKTTTAAPTPDDNPGHALAVPNGLPIAPAEWAAMTAAERAEAIALYTAEVEETIRDLAIEFPKLKVPTGGGQHWTLPNGEPAKYFDGVVVAHFKARAYWPLDAPVSNNPPACSSFDGRYPISGKGPTGATQCAACPHAQFGSGKEQRGQACKERMNVFLMMADSDLPRLLSLPPTSLKLFSRYARDLVDKKPVRPLSTLVTRFTLGLKPAAHVPGEGYSIVLPVATDQTLEYAEVRAVLAMRKKFQEAMSRRGITEAEVEEADHDDGNGHGTVIDGQAEVVGGGDPKAKREDAGF